MATRDIVALLYASQRRIGDVHNHRGDDAAQAEDYLSNLDRNHVGQDARRGTPKGHHSPVQAQDSHHPPVNSAGGRYHFNDDWEFYDTQVANFEFEGGRMITWEGKSCNSFEYYQRGRGVTIHGTKGTVLLDRNGIQVYDLDGNVVKELKESELSATTDTVGIGGLDVRHMQNFVNGLRGGEALTAPVADGYRSNLLCHLGNISQKFGRTLATDPKSGRIKNDDEAMKMWSRDYELGWEPSV